MADGFGGWCDVGRGGDVGRDDGFGSGVEALAYFDDGFGAGVEALAYVHVDMASAQASKHWLTTEVQ